MDEQQQQEQSTQFPYPVVNYVIRRCKDVQCNSCDNPALFISDNYIDLLSAIKVAGKKHGIFYLMQMQALRDQLANRFIVCASHAQCTECIEAKVKTFARDTYPALLSGAEDLTDLQGSIVLGTISYSFSCFASTFAIEVPVTITTTCELVATMRQKLGLDIAEL